MGYKGGNGSSVDGVFVCPYLPIASDGYAFDDTFFSYYTRLAYHYLDAEYKVSHPDTKATAEDYYRLISFPEAGELPAPSHTSDAVTVEYVNETTATTSKKARKPRAKKVQ